MKILLQAFTRNLTKPLLVLLAAAIFAFAPVPADCPGPWRGLGQASAQEQVLPGKLTREQQQKIIEKNARIRRLQEGIIDHKIKILDSKTKERTLLGELEKIEKEMRQQQNMLAGLRRESEEQEVLLSAKQEYLSQVLAEKRAHQVHVKNRLAAYYRMGSVGLMNVLFASETLPELLDFQEYFGLMMQHDHAIIQKYLARLQESNRAREAHSREKLRLMKLAEEVRENETRLAGIRQEKNLLLQKVNTEQHLYEQAVAEIEDAAADLAATLQRLQSTAAAPAAVNHSSPTTAAATGKPLPPETVDRTGFAARKGHLDPPVPGAVITRFGQKIEGRFGSATIAEGIDIEVAAGTEIKAVYDGRIIHSGYLRGYGNLIIVDHGQHYFSLISRAADLYKKEGSKVTAGEIIGTAGEGDPLYGDGLHFQIRQGSNPEDPLLWLKKDAFRPEATSSAVP